MAYKLVHEIREVDPRTRQATKLVLTHTFHGTTPEEAVHFYESHLKSDSFLRECVEQGLFQGRVPCKVSMHWETG